MSAYSHLWTAPCWLFDQGHGDERRVGPDHRAVQISGRGVSRELDLVGNDQRGIVTVTSSVSN